MSVAMPLGVGNPEGSVSDVKVLGEWNFTLQDDTPLYWLKCGNLEHYLLRCRVRCPCPCSVGMVWHSEAEGSGMEGVSFWMERTLGKRRYFLGGSDLESEPVVTREYVTSEGDDGGYWTEEWEALVQGYTACVFVQGRKVSLKCRCIRNSGAIAFFNATRPSEAEMALWSGSTEVHFSHVSLTTLTRGPLTVSGMLAAREKVLTHSISPEEKQLQLQRAEQKRGATAGSETRGRQGQRLKTPELSDGRIRPKSTPALPSLPRRKRLEPRVLSQEELSKMSQTGARRELRMKACGAGQILQDPRQQIKFVPALKEMQRNERREELMRETSSTLLKQDSPARDLGLGEDDPRSPKRAISASAGEKSDGVFWPLPQSFGSEEDATLLDADSKLPDIYREPISRLKQDWQQERARTADVDRQMSITFQAIFRLEQRVATLGRSHPAKLREKMDRKLDELNAQLAELHVYRERCTASLRRVEEDIQRVRDRHNYDAYLDKKVDDHMSLRPEVLSEDKGELKTSTKGLATKREERALQLGGSQRPGARG